jgi:hypothetical protein
LKKFRKTLALGGVVNLVASSPPITEDIRAMGREIESLQSIGW